MPSPNHHRTKNQLTQRPPRPTKTIRLIRQPNTDPHTPIRTHNFKDHVEDTEDGGVGLETRALDYHDEEDG